MPLAILVPYNTFYRFTMDRPFCWQRSLEEDIHSNLRKKELLLPTFHGQSPQLGQRRYLVDWLAVIWEKHSICSSARQLTVTLLDFFMDMFDIEARQLQLVALGSLLVATKFEEQDIAYPRLSDLRDDIPDLKYTNNEFLQMELLLLDFYGWNISFPTAAHFTSFYVESSLDKSDLLRGSPIVSHKSMKRHLQSYVAYFLEISMQDHYYRGFRPSLVAAACIACSRICMCIAPSWNGTLQNLSSYTLSDLTPLMDNMLRTHSHDEMLQSVPTPPTTPKQAQGSAGVSSQCVTPRHKAIPPVSCSMDSPTTPPND